MHKYWLEETVDNNNNGNCVLDPAGGGFEQLGASKQFGHIEGREEMSSTTEMLLQKQIAGMI